MKKLIIIFLLALLSCHDPQETTTTYSIIIYGTNSCSYTLALKNDCLNNNLAFTFCDIEIASCYNDAIKVVNEFKLGTVVNLPVVKLMVGEASYGFSRPSVYELKKLIK